MRKFKKGAPPTARGGGGKKKTMSRKKLTLKAQAAVEKGREATFMSKLFLATGGALEAIAPTYVPHIPNTITLQHANDHLWR